MKEIINEYKGKLGAIQLVRYIEDGKITYHVVHSNPVIPGGAWFDNMHDAIRHYQFMCAKY